MNNSTRSAALGSNSITGCDSLELIDSPSFQSIDPMPLQNKGKIDRLEPSQQIPPLLRWAGSKKRQFNSLKEFFPRSFNEYVEPFAGSAAFLFRLQPKSAKINDINTDLCNFYRHARRHPEEFYNAFIRLKRDSSTYYEARSQFNLLRDGFDKSVLFYFLNRNCFNGIYRINKHGSFNVPFSDERVSPYLSFDEFQQSCNVVRRAKIFSLDFEEFCLEHVSKDDFVFLDPPYYRSGSRIFNEYCTTTFGDRDFERLDNVLRTLNQRGAKFLLSFPRTRESIQLATQWNSITTFVRRTVAGNPSARRKQSEMLIFNYDKK